MGNSQTYRKANFEDVQSLCKNNSNSLLINTLDRNEQKCLLINTICCDREEEVINSYLGKAKDKIIVIYGRNSNDKKIYEKYDQLSSLGFCNLYLYVGGLFEWLLLQDIYGEEEFPTTEKELDILRFKSLSLFNTPLLKN